MKKLFFIILISGLALVSCSENLQQENNSVIPETEYIQEATSPERRIPLNFDSQRGVWIPYTQFEEIMSHKSEEDFKNIIQHKIYDFAEKGINTVYFHVRPCGDAYYKSEIFPKGNLLDGDFDPLEIVTDTAHDYGISVHAWINPLRCQTVSEMENVPDDFIVKKWINENSDFVNTVNERYYLNPAYSETDELICDGVREILENYNVDGVHIDDYFYPTKETYFDEKAFTESDSDNLSQWRMQNCDRLVKSIYDTVKEFDSRIVFGISPQGNISANYDSQFADVEKWAGSTGYCDYIVPQIYFGFKNETCPFAETLKQWENLVSESGVSLVIGLAEYKLGKEDVWAGETGINEWIDNPDIINQQIQLVIQSTADGYALY